MGKDPSEARSNGPDFEIFQMLTEVEQEILKNALAKRAKNEILTIVEEVIFREYELKLKARELQRQADKRNLSNGGSV